MLQAINSYCNILQYKEGGKQPIECKGPSTDLSSLISKQVTLCTEERFRYYKVPTTPSGQDDKAYVDIPELFKGASVNFKIPNSQWLVDNDWIKEREINNTFYVKKLEVYLPTTPTRPTDFLITADPILKNQITPKTSSTEYMIVPSIPLTSEYTLGPRRTPCSFEKLPNPYTSCKAEVSSFTCPSTTDEFLPLYPSLYSQWTITVDGGEHLSLPKPATDMSVFFRIKLCKVRHNQFQDELVQLQEVDDYCPSGQYRANITADCADCPVNSHSALSGHYCAKD